jgi:molybdopterin adenylyltransferase
VLALHVIGESCQIRKQDSIRLASTQLCFRQLQRYNRVMYPAAIITCSDASSRGEREDRSGPAVRELLKSAGYSAGNPVIVPDEIKAIATAIRSAADRGARLIVTTGGTGIGPRDITPEATLTVCEKTIPGFGELMRTASLLKTRKAALSRCQAAILKTALVVNLPGSVAGATENLEAILDLIPHALELLAGNTEHPSQPRE